MTKWAKVQRGGSIEWPNSGWTKSYNPAKVDWQVLWPRPCQMRSQFTFIYFISIIYLASIMKVRFLCDLVQFLIYYLDHLRDLRQEIATILFLHFKMGTIETKCKSYLLITCICQLQFLNRTWKKQLPIWHYPTWTSIGETTINSINIFSTWKKFNSWTHSLFNRLKKGL